jgi:hypothetical protein
MSIELGRGLWRRPRTAVVVFVLGLLFGRVAHAEQAGPPAPKARAVVKVEDLADRMALHAATVGFAFSADMGTTSWALRRCPKCFEAGLGSDVEARVSLHVAYGTAALGACWLLERSGHRGWARAVAAGTAGIFGGAAVSNSIHAVRRK